MVADLLSLTYKHSPTVLSHFRCEREAEIL